VYFVLFIVCLCIGVCACPLQNNNETTKHRNNTNCGSAFEPGACGLPYYCASICVRSCCNWRASSVDWKKKSPGGGPVLLEELGVRGKRVGFRPVPAARHSQSARAHTDHYPWRNQHFPNFSGLSLLDFGKKKKEGKKIDCRTKSSPYELWLVASDAQRLRSPSACRAPPGASRGVLLQVLD